MLLQTITYMCHSLNSKLWTSHAVGISADCDFYLCPSGVFLLDCVQMSSLCTRCQQSPFTLYKYGILIVRITHSSFVREAAENAGWPWGRGRPSGSLSLGSCFHVSSCRNNEKCLEELNSKKMVKNRYAYVPRGAHIFQTQKPKIWVMSSVYPRQRGLISQ